MEKIPTPQKKYLLTIPSKIYELTITKGKDKISFCYYQNDSLINTQYEDSYSLYFFKSISLNFLKILMNYIII